MLSLLNRYQMTDRGQIGSPSFVWPVSAQHRLHLGTSATHGRFDEGDRLPPADDGDPLSPMLNRIEKVREIACGLGGTNLCHQIRLSDIWTRGHATRLFPKRRWHTGLDFDRPVPDCRLEAHSQTGGNGRCKLPQTPRPKGPTGSSNPASL